MGIITRVIDAIESDEIRETINHEIDNDFIYCGDWEVEMHHVNIYLNKLLMRKLSLSNISINRSVMSDARRVLQSVDEERDINAWVSDLKEYYFPVLEKVWG